MSWVGRSTELAELAAFLGAPRVPAIRVAQITGEPSIGKTALARRALARLPELVVVDSLRDGLAVADRRNSVVLLDDLHLAGAESLDLLGRLIRCPDRAWLTVLACYRPRQLAPALQAVLDEADGPRLELGPLSQAECAELLGGSPGSRRLAELHAGSGGNPSYLQALTGEPAAATVAAVLSEVDGLGEFGGLVLRAAAVVGEEITADLVAAAGGESFEVVSAALDAALAADLLRAREHGPVLEFRHPVLRGIVYRSAPLGWRVEAHCRVAAALRRVGAPAAERARHLEIAAPPGSRPAAEVLVRAAREVRAKDPDTAARWLAAAQRLCPALDVRLELADTQIAAGLAEPGMALFQEVVGEAGHTAARALVRYSAVERMFGRNRTARALLRRALATWPDGDPVELAAVRAELAYAAHNTGDRQEAVRLAEQVLGIELPRRAALIHAACHALLAYDHWTEGDCLRAQQAADRSVALVDEATTAELAEWLPIVEQCAGVALHLTRYADAHRQGQRSQAAARASGQRLVLLRGHLRAAYAAVLTGDWDQAEAELAEADAQAVHTGRPPVFAYGLALRAHLAGERGNPVAALEFAEQAVELAPAGDHPWWAQVHWELVEARRELDLPVPEDFLTEVAHQLPPFYLEQLAESALRRGEPVEAADWARRCRAQAHDPVTQAYATLAEARLLLAGRDWVGAAALAVEAAERFARTPLRPSMGRARLVAGTALAGAGQREHALAELDRAAVVFAGCGASRALEQTVRVQRGLGRRVSRAAGRVAPGELTAREREVARLVSEGCPNRVIAQRLVLSERTVTTHVSNILAKTGTTSRTALAAHLLRG